MKKIKALIIHHFVQPYKIELIMYLAFSQFPATLIKQQHYYQLKSNKLNIIQIMIVFFPESILCLNNRNLNKLCSAV